MAECCELSGFVLKGREPGPQMQHRFGVNLTDPRLGYTKDSADFLKGEILVVVQGQDEFFSLRQTVDGLSEHLTCLGNLECPHRAMRGSISDGVAKRDGVAAIAADGQDLIECS